MNLEAPSPYVLRPARRSDGATVVSLWLNLHREHEAIDGRYVLARDAGDRWRNDFEEWVDDGAHCILMSLLGAEAIGFIHAYRRMEPPIFESAPEVYIDEIYVLPNHRGCGVGAALLRAVKIWGVEGGAEWIRLRALAKNEAGVRFWEKQGGEALSITYTIPLEKSEDTSASRATRKIGF